MITLWFFNDSTGADYGTFECSKCGEVFHYSPRDIEENGETVAERLCAECAAKY